MKLGLEGQTRTQIQDDVSNNNSIIQHFGPKHKRTGRIFVVYVEGTFTLSIFFFLK